MRERTIDDLEVELVLDQVRRHSLSTEGRRRISVELFSDDSGEVSARRERIALIISRLVAGECALTPFPSLEGLFESGRRKAVDFDGLDLVALSDYIASLGLLARFEENTWLANEELASLGRDIAEALDGEGHVKDSHPLVRPLYSALEKERERRQSYAEDYIAHNASLFQSSQAVYRNERVMLPVRRESRSAVQGYVQGQSATGSTFFVEPFELVELNNRVTLAQDEIMRVKRQILLSLSSRTRSLLPLVAQMAHYVADFDFHYSFACQIRADRWEAVGFGEDMRIVSARHPLLGAKAVPISLSAPKGKRTIVLSGANAGGKTVTMKTVAILSILAQMCGYAPLAQGSVLPLYTSILTDIGDGQSITDDFSTFSGHMSNIASICREARPSSLILLDEIGSGTDPAEGAALTDSLLDYFKGVGAMVLITSHYNQVKLHAYGDDAMMNASMEFDEEGERPTFRVIEGLPGDSHAIATARRMGIPAVVIRSAKESLSSSSSVSQLIASLNGKSRALDRKVSEAALEKRRYERLAKEAEAKERALEEERLRLQEGEADELGRWMKEARRRLERLVKDVSTGQLTKEKTRAVKDFIASMEDEGTRAQELVEEGRARRRQAVRTDYEVGQEVLCGSFHRRGTIVRVLGKGRYQVSIDSMKIDLGAEDIQLAPVEGKASVATFASRTPAPSLTLDVRGMRLEAAIEAVDDEIEACLVHSLSTFSIIHGYGNGILSQGIHAHLKKLRSVKEYYFARPEDGGMGKTYVTLAD